MHYTLQKELAAKFVNVRARMIVDLLDLKKGFEKGAENLENKLLEFSFYGENYDSFEQLRKLRFELSVFEEAYTRNSPNLNNNHLKPFIEKANQQVTLSIKK